MDAIDWPRMPPLTALRAFEATARLKGFSAAARALNVTHAAVAQQVRALEEHLGAPLVWREGKGLTLTAEGERLALALNDGFATIQGAVTALRQTGADRPLRVTMTPAFAVQWLMPRLGRFWAQHPEIPLSLHPDERALDLRREGVDLGIRFGRGRWPGTEAEFLTSARYVVVGAPSLLGDRERLTLAEMAALPWVREQDWPEQNSWLEAIGLDPAKLDFTGFPNEDLALSAARQGYGLHVESAALVDDDLKADRLRAVFDLEDDRHGYYIVTPPGPRRAEAKAFVRWLRAEALEGASERA